MSLFNKNKSEEKTSGNIPEELGIKQSRANEIIEAVRQQYKDARGNVNKVIDIIKGEDLTENEAIFAYYALGAIKVKEGSEMAMELLGLLKELREEMED